MENIYLNEIKITGSINIENLLFDLSCVSLNLTEEENKNYSELKDIVSTLNEHISSLLKHIKFQNRQKATQTWTETLEVLKTLPSLYFELRLKTLESNKELIEKYKLPEEIEKELLGIIEKSDKGYLM